MEGSIPQNLQRIKVNVSIGVIFGLYWGYMGNT